jgi:AraC family transcriptional activator of pobA
MNVIPLKSKIGVDQLIKISTFKEVIKPTIPHKHAAYYEIILLSEGAGYHIIDFSVRINNA